MALKIAQLTASDGKQLIHFQETGQGIGMVISRETIEWALRKFYPDRKTAPGKGYSNLHEHHA